MIPKAELNVDAIVDFGVNEIPSSNTYRLDVEKERVSGMTDELEAMGQAVHLILNTERYHHAIYSWNYGVELAELMGKPIHYAVPEIKRRITDALLQDNRIESVSDFTFTAMKGKVLAEFTVQTIFGDVRSTKEVMV